MMNDVGNPRRTKTGNFLKSFFFLALLNDYLELAMCHGNGHHYTA